MNCTLTNRREDTMFQNIVSAREYEKQKQNHYFRNCYYYTIFIYSILLMTYSFVAFAKSQETVNDTNQDNNNTKLIFETSHTDAVTNVGNSPSNITTSPSSLNHIINRIHNDNINSNLDTFITSPTPAPQTAVVFTTPTTLATTSAPFLSNQTPASSITSNQVISTLAPVAPTPPPPVAPSSQPLTTSKNPLSSPLLAQPSSSLNKTVQFLRAKSKDLFRCNPPLIECDNGGICMHGDCFCPAGFTGVSCAINIDECRQTVDPCLNNGTCIDEVASFRCECVAGFKGERCQDPIDMCNITTSSPCKNGACINHRTDYSCECEAGWEGRHCDENVNECLKNPCQNNGTCQDLINDYKCDCGSSGFSGKNCDVDIDDCAAKPCGFGAKECVDLTAGFKCICYDGFEGEKCEKDIDECHPLNPCENNSTCIQNSISLHQQHNSTTDLTIYHDIKDQNSNSSNMDMSQYAGYKCHCREEYYGDRCEERKKCYTKSVFELCNHQQAECVNAGSSYECLINASFDGSGQNYAIYRVNGEFKMKEIYVKYRSLTGGIIMSFETTQPDTPIADLQLNKSGLYLSGAPIKRNENIKFDELLDGTEREIKLGLDTPTEIRSITLSRQNISTDLHSPFKGCLTQVRLNNELVPLVDYAFGMNYSFELTENRLDVGQCRTCFEKDCLNHGHCEFQEGYDHCTCPDTFTGNFCEIDVNECEKNFGLCLNGGSCENLRGGYRCNCKEGFRGEKCQEISDYCKAKQPCVTGTCKNVNPAQGTYQCECPSSNIGKRCDRKRDCINECHNNHAYCVNNVTCACFPGRREERIMCEYVASCEQVEGELCLNGGVCKNLESGGYHCACQEPYYGPICQFLEKRQIEALVLVGAIITVLMVAFVAIGFFMVFRSVRKARATQGTYSPSAQEKFGNSASDLLKPPQPERLI